MKLRLSRKQWQDYLWPGINKVYGLDFLLKLTEEQWDKIITCAKNDRFNKLTEVLEEIKKEQEENEHSKD